MDHRPDTRSLAATGPVEADRRHLLHPQHHPADHTDPIFWERGDGVYLIDRSGRRYIDGLSGMWNVHVGHGRQALADAAAEQMSRLAFANVYAGASHGPAVDLAVRLAQLAPDPIEAFFFTSGGSEATDTSIRTARWYWQALGRPEKSKIVSRQLSYHGSTIGAASATGVDEFSATFGPRLPGFLHIPSPYPYRFDGTGRQAADLLEQALIEAGPETVAAFIAEPIQGGGGGVIVPQDDYFPRIRDICDRYDVLLIADEVITGFGRTGRWFAVEHWGVAPDILQFAKGITSGYLPFGGIGVSRAIKAAMDAAPSDRRWWHGFTASAHPVAAAVALANLDIIANEGLVAAAERLGARLLDRLRAGLAGHPHVGDIRGLGLLAGIELVADRAARTRFAADAGLAARLRFELRARGLYTRVLTDVVCLAPPLSTPPSTVDEIADITIAAIAATFNS